MGSNMQRQAVPLLATEPPRVATGLERMAAQQSGMAVKAEKAGIVTYVDAQRIRVDQREYILHKFTGLNGGTCLNQKPIVRDGQKVEQGQVIADGPAMRDGELALGRNLRVAFLSWEGYCFEDGIVVSERLVKEGLFTSLHIKEFVAETRRQSGETDTSREEFSPYPPNFSAESVSHLDERGVVKVGTHMQPGQVLVGKVTPLERVAISPEERLFSAIFAQAAKQKSGITGPREVKNDSLQMPEGASGVVIGVCHFLNRATLSAKEQETFESLAHAKEQRFGAAHIVQLVDDLPADVRQRVQVTVAIKRPLQVGDKMSGRHGNKGVVARILPVEDMPYLADGTPVDILLNPLGVPSRMNIGQILETQLGWAAEKLDFQAVTPVFSGVTEEDVRRSLKEAGLPESGAVDLYDGRTGERFEQPVTVGSMYILKLRHLIDDKTHARSTGPYSLISQQPLGGKTHGGGQRFGEMEVWALEAHGAAHLLQELMTVKADDVEGRMRLYEAILEGRDEARTGKPASLDVLVQELRGLCLDLGLASPEDVVSVK